MKHEVTFTIFGGTGDLTFRKLLPALYNMEASGNRAFAGPIVIIGRRDYTAEQYRELARGWVEKFHRLPYRQETFEKLAQRISYYKMDFTDTSAYEALNTFYLEIQAVHPIFYFAVAPRYFSAIVDGLKRIHGAETGKVVLEKPFGENLKAAGKLNQKLETFFGPDRIYRIDHYLGKEMVRNILTIRFANPIFSNVWDAEHIESIRISALEEVGVETRGGYYDHSGALKDMVQNHLFQILSIVAMEQPEELKGRELHRAQQAVLDALKPPENPSCMLVLGQYGGYRFEPFVAENSETETYAALTVYVDNDRWRGMPFYIRTGKKLKQREMQVDIVFKRPSPEVEPDILNIKIQPTEGVYLQFNIKKPGESDEIAQAKMDFCQSCSYLNQLNTPEAYERLLAACVSGELSWFSQWNQIETSWRYIDAIRNLYRERKLPVYEYESGSFGPDAAEEMLRNSGDSWNDTEK